MRWRAQWQVLGLHMLRAALNERRELTAPARCVESLAFPSLTASLCHLHARGTRCHRSAGRRQRPTRLQMPGCAAVVFAPFKRLLQPSRATGAVHTRPEALLHAQQTYRGTGAVRGKLPAVATPRAAPVKLSLNIPHSSVAQAPPPRRRRRVQCNRRRAPPSHPCRSSCRAGGPAARPARERRRPPGAPPCPQLMRPESQRP